MIAFFIVWNIAFIGWDTYWLIEGHNPGLFGACLAVTVVCLVWMISMARDL